MNSLEMLDRAQEHFGVPLYPAAYDQIGERALEPDDIRLVAAAGLAIAQEMGISDQDALEITKTHLQMLHNLEQYIDDRESGMSQSELYEHQHDVFHKVHDFFAHPPQDEDGQFIRHGYIKLPTGTGKTAIFTTLVDVLNRPVGDDGKKLKSLVLVPKLDLVEQTKGQEDAASPRGFARFAKDTSVSEYHGGTKDLDGDAVIMTYNSFRNLVKAGKLPKDLFDVIICDELHNALGAKTSEALKQYGADKFILGLTATEKYADDKKVIDLLPYEIDSMELREAIEEGFLAPVRCIAIESDATIETIRGSGSDFSEEELRGLIENEWRNQKAVEFAKSFVEEGRQGLVSCLPGEDLRHAKLIASEISKQQIIDTNTGQIRNIRAIAVSGKMSKKERQKIYTDYEQGNYDVLTYVDLLTEGWDSVHAKFLINLRPTTSPVNAIQRLGRILRPDEGNNIATVVEFIDKADKPQFTFYHALGKETIQPYKIYGKDNNESGSNRAAQEIANLPEDIRALLRDIDHKLIGELIITKRESLIPDGYMSLTSFATNEGVTTKTIIPLLEKYGIEPHSLHSGRNMANYLDPDQQALLRTDTMLTCPPITDDDVSISILVAELSSSRPQLQKIAAELGIDIVHKKVQGRPSLTVRKTDVPAIKVHAHFQEREEIQSNIPLYKAGKRLGVSPNVVKKLAEELNIELKTILVANGKTTTILTDDQVTQIEGHPLFKIPMADEGSLTYRVFAAEIGEREGTVIEIAVKHGIIAETRRTGTATPAMVLTTEQQDQIKALPYFAMKTPQPGEISLKAGADQLGISSTTLEQLLKELNIPSNVRRGKHRGTYFLESDLAAVQDSPYMKIEPITDADELLYKLAESLGVGPASLRQVCIDAGIAVPQRRGANSHVSEVTLKSDRSAIEAALEQKLPRKPEGYLTIGEFCQQHETYAARVKTLGKQHGITFSEHRSKAGKLTPTLSPEQQATLLELLLS